MFLMWALSVDRQASYKHLPNYGGGILPQILNTPSGETTHVSEKSDAVNWCTECSIVHSRTL